MTDTVKTYVPTPTKKGGVAEVEARPDRYLPGSYEASNGGTNFWQYDLGKDWFLDKAAALAEAEARRQARIASLKRQIEKLEKIGPFVNLKSAS